MFMYSLSTTSFQVQTRRQFCNRQNRAKLNIKLSDFKIERCSCQTKLWLRMRGIDAYF